MMFLGKILPLTIVILLLIVAPAMAFPPDAGQLLREQKPKPPLPRQLPEPEDKTNVEQPAAKGQAVHVTAFTFIGYEEIADVKELQAQVAQYLEKDLTFAQLQAVVQKITRYLKEQGWFLARAYLPRQNVTNGRITIIISQGKSDGSLNIKDDGTLRINKKHLKSIGEKAVRKNQPVQRRDLERAVLLMNDRHGVSAKASLSPGAEPGTTAVKIKASEGPLINGAMWSDNYGNRYTGKWRGNAMLRLNDPLHVGDRGTIIATGSENFYLGELIYSLPISSNGLCSKISYTGLYYKLGKDLKSLDATGDAHTVNAGLSYPWVRSRTSNLYTTLSYEYKNLSDSITHIEMHEKELNSIVLGANGNHYDSFFGGGTFIWNAGITRGRLDESQADIAITGMEGGYTYISAGLTRMQRLAHPLVLTLCWHGQFSCSNLDSSEQFSLGGPYGIRAYPVGEAMGDQGHRFTLQLDYDTHLPARYGTLKLNVFYDGGYINLHKDAWPNAVTTATGKNHYWLHGAGLGLTYACNETIRATACWAHTLGSNNGRDFEGNDADGKRNNNRFWVQAVWIF